MLKSLIRNSIINMNSEKKLKQTLSKKLSGKKVPIKKELKVAEGESKSQHFSKLKNNEKNAKKEATLHTKLENSKAGSSEVVKTEVIYTKRTTRNSKVDVLDSKSSTEILNAKPEKITKTTTKKKIPVEEEPCSSKKIKDELPPDKWEPSNWKLVLENIRNMRSNDNAPVDTMGCHKCADENADEKTQRFHKLVALMLSSQTKDETTYHAMLRLREHTLTPEVICDMKVNVLENTLHPVSFYKNKAKYLQQTSKILVEKYNSDIPNNIKELVALPGVGPKMAHICMATAWQEITGIGVDVHVHRISNRLGWVPKPTKEPEQTRVALESWLPQNLWSDVNHLLVGFGQTTCTPLKPKCSVCLNCLICPSAPKTIKNMDKVQNSKVMELCDKVKFKKSKIHL